MPPSDQERLGKLISEFIDGCGFEPPVHVIAIGSNGSVSVSVSRHSLFGVKQVCGHGSGPGMAPPIVVTVVAEDGRGKSAKIEIIEAAPTMQ
jgi:hypothetical protein